MELAYNHNAEGWLVDNNGAVDWDGLATRRMRLEIEDTVADTVVDVGISFVLPSPKGNCRTQDVPLPGGGQVHILFTPQGDVDAEDAKVFRVLTVCAHFALADLLSASTRSNVRIFRGVGR